MKKLVSLFVAVLLFAVAAVPFAMSASAEPATFVVSHYNDTAVEGACVVFTEEYTACTWWLHIAFTPVEGEENTYEVTQIVNGLSDGSGVPLAIPEGGFVYALNSGNNWGDLTQAAIDAGNLESQWWYGNYQADPEYYTTNFNNALTNSMIAVAQTWSVGDKFVITGIDLNGVELPVSSTDIMWYDEGFTCTSTYEPFADGSLLPEESEIPEEPSEEPSEEPEEEPDAESEPVANESNGEASSVPAEEDPSNNTWIYIAVAVAAVVVVVILVVVFTKKKK